MADSCGLNLWQGAEKKITCGRQITINRLINIIKIKLQLRKSTEPKIVANSKQYVLMISMLLFI